MIRKLFFCTAHEKLQMPKKLQELNFCTAHELDSLVTSTIAGPLTDKWAVVLQYAVLE